MTTFIQPSHVSIVEPPSPRLRGCSVACDANCYPVLHVHLRSDSSGQVGFHSMMQDQLDGYRRDVRPASFSEVREWRQHDEWLRANTQERAES